MGFFSVLIVVAIGAYVYQTYFASRPPETKDERFNAQRHKNQVELDSLLDKIASNGMDSLTDSERRRLDELSGKH
jgi:hypothetical protein